jgi:AcrR family transcriptional regulator
MEKRRRMPGTQRRELIVAAARTLLTERAYDDVSIGDIAARAGVSRTVLYDHFPSKKALVQSFLTDEMTALVSVLAGQVRNSGGSVRERMTAVLDAHFTFMQERPLAFRILALDSRCDPEVAATGHRLRMAANQALGLALSADFDRAGVAPDNALREANVAMLTAAIQGVSTWWFDHPEIPRSEIVNATAGWLWSGLGGLAGQAAEVPSGLAEAED